MEKGLQITKTGTENTVTLVLTGRLDTTTAPQLELELDAIFPDVTDLTLDFENLEYISSAGLRVLLKAQKTMSHKGTMKLVKVPAGIMEVFDITGFVDILTIV